MFTSLHTHRYVLESSYDNSLHLPCPAINGQAFSIWQDKAVEVYWVLANVPSLILDDGFRGVGTYYMYPA